MKTQATRAMKEGLVKMSAVVRVMVGFACCLFLTQTSYAQNINTLGYATVDFDEENNIVYGYAFTEPGYSAGIYYNQTYVGATIFDANNNVVAAVPNHTAYGRAEISFQGPGTGNPPYTIKSGHMVFMTYYVSNYWDPYTYQYRSGWLDYYYYSFYSPGGAGYPTLAEVFFDFLGRSPYTVSSSINRFLGNLLSEILGSAGPQVTFKVATIPGDQDSFSGIGSIQSADLIATSSLCNPYNNFTLTVTYDLAQSTQEVVSVVARGFGSTHNSNWYVQSVTHQDVFTSPPHGEATIIVNNKNGGQTGNPPYNAIQVTVKGKFGSGTTYSTTGRVRINCP